MEFHDYLAKPGELARVRFVQLLLSAVGVWFFFWAYDLLLTFGLNLGDGGVLRPIAERYLWAFVMIVLGASFIAAASLYVRQYVVRIIKLGGSFEITTLGFFRSKSETFDSQNISLVYHEGKSRTSKPSVDAPWWELNVPGRKLPYIINAK